LASLETSRIAKGGAPSSALNTSYNYFVTDSDKCAGDQLMGPNSDRSIPNHLVNFVVFRSFGVVRFESCNAVRGDRKVELGVVVVGRGFGN
jgi:hypothetical protein